jgi:hypothetical protein
VNDYALFVPTVQAAVFAVKTNAFVMWHCVAVPIKLDDCAQGGPIIERDISIEELKVEVSDEMAT